MTSFNGPWSKDLDSFKKSVQSMPEEYKASFASASKATLEKICDPSVLHVWESDSDIDSLLQLTSVIAKLCDLGVRKEQGPNAKDGSMLIVAEESKGKSHFGRICQLVEHLTGADGKRHLEGTVAAFSKIVVVRGWDNGISSGQTEALEKTVKRINIAIDRIFSMGKFEGRKRKIVWHHGAIIHFLLHWINTTTSPLRSALTALTITNSLNLTNGVAPSPTGRANKLVDLERLEQYAKKLDISVVFLDPSSHLITFEYLGTYMYFYAYYINTFLPTSLSRPHLHKAMDELVTFAFRLRAASEGRYGSDAVKMVQKHLDGSKAKHWARTCVSTSTYEKSECRAAGKDECIHHAVQLADSPFALLRSENGVPAFARLAVGPAAAGSQDCFVAAPVTISFSQARFRPSSPSPFYILLPAQNQDLEKVTNRIQGLMMAVLERVRQEKGNPQLGEADKGIWGAVVSACTWAIEGCEGKMPKGVCEKVKFVREKLKEGTWGYALGAATDGKTSASTSTAANTTATTVLPMPEPNRSFGFGHGTQQTMGMHSYNAQSYPQQQMPNSAGYPQYQCPTPSPVQGTAYAQPVQGFGGGQSQAASMPPAMNAQGQGHGQTQGYGQGMAGGVRAPQLVSSGFAKGQQGGAMYPQSMGGRW